MQDPRLLAAALVLVAIAATGPARAQTDGQPMAEALFQDGRDLLAAGKTKEACAKLAASQHIEPKLGTLLNLAVCHEAEGKTASAWAEFKQAEVQAGRTSQAEREEFARRHVTDLEPKLSRVSIATANVEPILVSIDGVEVDRAVLGTAFPVDPGDHTLVVSAPAKRAWTYRLVVPAGASATTVEVPALVPAPPPAIAVAPPAQPIEPRAPELGTPSRTPGWIAVGAGGLAVGLGTYFGVLAFSNKDQALAECHGQACTQRGLDLFDDSRTAGTVSTIAFGIGAVAIGAGLYLLLRPSGPPPRSARVRPTRTGIGLCW